MARFAYRALSAEGEMVEGRIGANSRDMAMDRLAQRGVLPLELDLVEDGGGPGGRLTGRLFQRKPGTSDLLLFTRELALLLGAGAPMARALSTLDRIVERGPMRGVAGRLLAEISAGAAPEKAMAGMPEVFPPWYVGMIRAGGAGGAMVAMLERLAGLLERSDALDRKVRGALVYPIMVLAVTGLSLVILMVLVIPEFRPIFEEAGDLPFSTRMVMAASDLVTEHGLALLGGLLALVLLIQRAGASAAGRRLRDRWLLALPLFGDLARKIETARFCRSLGTLRANGVELTEGIGIAAGTLGNAEMAEAARAIAAPLGRGEGLAGPMRQTGCFPFLATQLVEVGEESGRLEAMLLQVADIFDRETESSIQKLLSLLSPLLTIFLGLLIALIIGSILMAILGSYDMVI